MERERERHEATELCLIYHVNTYTDIFALNKYNIALVDPFIAFILLHSDLNFTKLNNTAAIKVTFKM